MTEDHRKKKIQTGIPVDSHKESLFPGNLEESRQFFEDLEEISFDLIWQSDTKGRFTYANPAWERSLGYKPQEMLGRTLCDFQTPEFAKRDLRECKSVIKEGVLREYETIFISKTGVTVYLVLNLKCVYGKDGKTAGYRGVARDISLYRHAQDNLKEGEERFRRIYEEGQFGITIAGTDFKFVGANPAFCRMIGYTEEELSNFTFSDITHPDNVAKDTDKVNALKRGELRVYKTEKKYVKKNGAILWGSLMTSAIRDKEDRILYYLAMVLDITERKTAEDTLRENEEKFRSIIEQNSEGVVLLTRKGEIIEWNRAVERISGISRATAIGKSFFDIQEMMMAPAKRAPERVEYIKKTISEALSSDKSPLFKQPVEATFTRNGETVNILQTVFPIQTGDDYRIGAIIRDITEQKKAEKAIASEKERLAITLRSIGDGVITSDIAGNVDIINKVAEQLTGWKQEEARGMPLATIFHIVDEHTLKRYENPVEKVFSSGQTVELSSHKLLVSKDGTKRLIADSGAPIKDNRGTTVGVVLVFRDITKKQKLLDAAQKTQRIESLGLLAGGIAHDFNNLLGGIYGNIEMMRTVSNDARIASYIDATMSTLNRARNLTQQLLTFAKGGAPVRKVAALFPFIRETVEFSLSGSNVSCTYRVPDDLWLCEYDANQIGQVIDNLMINAIQAMPLGGTVTIGVTNILIRSGEKASLAAGRYIKISVSDSGVGIPKEIQSRVFDPFFTTKQKGSGLGLATSYSIVRRHGGAIELESEAGKGSTFHLFMPASSQTHFNTKTVSAHLRKGSGKILVMDDEEVLRRTMCVMLSSLGYSAMTAKDGKDAVRVFKEETDAGRPFNVIILDLTVHGGMGGRETVAELQKIDDTVPVIVSSGYADDPIMANPYDYGFAGSLNKPFTLMELSQLLRFVIGA
jgi:PAS domain S-box-containing protein